MNDPGTWAGVASTVAALVSAISVGLQRSWSTRNDGLTGQAVTHAQMASAQIQAVAVKLADLELKLVSVQHRAEQVDTLRGEIDRLREGLSGLGVKTQGRLDVFNGRLDALMSDLSRCENCTVNGGSGVAAP